MNIRTTLLLLAASVAPLCSLPASAEPAAQLFTTMAAPAAQAGATAEQRAEVFSALALLPANVTDVITLTQVGSNMMRLAQSGRLPDFRPEDIPAELQALDGIAMAGTAANPAFYACLSQFLEAVRTREAAEELALDWRENARAELGETIMKTLQAAAMEAATPAPAAEGAEAPHLPPGYIIFTAAPGQEAVLQALHQELQQSLMDWNEPWMSRLEDSNGYSGVRMDFAQKQEADRAAGTLPIEEETRRLTEEMARHTLCIVTRLQGNALIIAACEDTAELQLAATPAESVLGTPLMADCDAQLADGLLAAGQFSRELTAFSQSANNDYLDNLAAGVRAVFGKLGEADAAAKPTYDKAAAALETLAGALRSLSRSMEKPSQFRLWWSRDNSLHLVADADAQGYSFAPGKLRLAALADAPSTAIYAETTPLLWSGQLPPLQTLVDAALSLTEGVALTLNEHDRSNTAQALAAARLFMPELQAMAAATATVGSGLDGQFALVLDSAHGSMPTFTPALQGTEADIPRLSLFAGVSERGKLGEGWAALKLGINQAVAKLGGPPCAADMLPFVPTQQGAMTSYHLALPFFTPDTVPSLALTDTGMAIGSSLNLNRQLVESATGNTDFAGCVVSFRPAPLARSLRSLATATDPHPEEAEPAASSKVRLEHGDKGAPVAIIGGEDGPTSVFVETQLAEQQRLSNELSEAAAAMEALSTVTEAVYATSGIADGTYTLHVEVKLRK